MKIKKIESKEVLEVKCQEDCFVSGQTERYQDGADCQKDCTAVIKMPWYKSWNY